MAILKYLLPALAIAGLAAGQNSCKGPKTIKSQGDANALSSCKKFEGDLIVAADIPKGGLTLNGIQEISGSLMAKGTQNLTALYCPELRSVGDTFFLSGAIEMRTLQCDALTSVGSLNLEALPNCQQLAFTKGVSNAKSILITNTALTSLKGISLKTVGNLDVSNNPQLMEANVDQITNITGFVGFSANHPDLKISFPKLESALNMTFRNVSAVEIPSLKTTEGLLGFYSNYFEKIAAPNLTSTGDLVFASNSDLKNISLPSLKTVNGAFIIANNTELQRIDGVPKLTTVFGALDFTGNISKVDLPSLKEVSGELNLQTTQKFDCDALKAQVGSVGDFVCKEQEENPQTGTTTTSGQKPKPSNAGALSPPSGIAMLVLIGGLLTFAL
ncbi:GPI-anchored cell wall organization protein Ecm33 [Histoplasma ohiense]|nr:GPI-anchored cell wall organization protein Ecm33 [Histoplasma ohiense (nom. inval.)]